MHKRVSTGLIELPSDTTEHQDTRWASSKTSSAQTVELNHTRIATKLLGLYGTWAILAFLYFVMPEYSKDFYGSFWSIAKNFVPIFALLAVPYFAWIDATMKDPVDSYWHMGHLFDG